MEAAPAKRLLPPFACSIPRAPNDTKSHASPASERFGREPIGSLGAPGPNDLDLCSNNPRRHVVCPVRPHEFSQSLK